MDNDTPRQQHIRIGDASIGLIGLQAALSRVLGRNLPEKEAVELLFKEISLRNYIPPGAEKKYRGALLQEYRRSRGELKGEPGGELSIRILGPPCVSCNNLKTMVIEHLQKLGLAADVTDIHELDEIWRYGVTRTPALLINGEVKCAGRQPSPAQVEQWLREAGV